MPSKSIEAAIEALIKQASIDIKGYAVALKKEQQASMQQFSKQRIYRSSILQNKFFDLQEEYTIKVEKRKEQLEKDIQKVLKTEDTSNSDTTQKPMPPFPEGYTPPYPVDMSLSYQDRYYAVCNHYLKYPSKEVALAEIENDIFIEQYLTKEYLRFLIQFIMVKLP